MADVATAHMSALCHKRTLSFAYLVQPTIGFWQGETRLAETEAGAAAERAAARFWCDIPRLLRCNNFIAFYCAPHHIDHTCIPPPPRKGFKMTEQFKIGEQFQKVGKEGFDAVVRAYGQTNKGFQAIAAEVTDYSKTAFEDATRAFQQLVSAKSAEQAFEIQSQYAKKAYDAYIAEMSKLGQMWVDLAREAYKPVERVVVK
jgi:Phasin protein